MRLRDFFPYQIVQLEAFADIGKLSADELSKGQALVPGDADNFRRVPGRVFKQVLTKFADIDRLRNNPKGLIDLSIYGVADYEKMHCYIGKNNTSGYAIKNGELVSVFSIAKSAGRAIVADAVARGANRLDCFAYRHPDGSISGHLYRLYSEGGFRIDTSMNEGTPGEPYAIVNGISSFVNANGVVEESNPSVVVFMRR